MQIHRIVRALALSCGALLLLPWSAGAEPEPGERMGALEERMRVLEDKLAASEATVAAQRELLQQHAPEVKQGGLDPFFNSLVFGGHVTASYGYNFNNPDFNSAAQPHFQFNKNHNSFQVDAIKFELGRAAAEPGTAGFQVDMLLGENAKILRASDIPYGGGVDEIVDGVGDSNIFFQEAYVAYNHDGNLVQLGKFETLLGYEVLDSPYNPNVTHGILYTFAIPLYHTGLLVSGPLAMEGWTYAAGIVNGFNNATDFNDNKGFLGRIGFTDGPVAVTGNAFIGSEGLRASATKGLPCTTPVGAPLPGDGGTPVGDCFGDNNNRTQIYNIVGTFQAADNLKTWIDLVYGFQELDSDVVRIPLSGQFPLTGVEDPQWYAAALGMKYAFNEQTSIALRGEIFHDDGNFRIVHGALGQEADHYTGTVTLAHKVTDNLLARLEYRHDVVDTNGPGPESDAVEFKHDGDGDDQQDFGILEVSYTFD
jgi:hypothetical protein